MTVEELGLSDRLRSGIPSSSEAPAPAGPSSPPVREGGRTDGAWSTSYPPSGR